MTNKEQNIFNRIQSEVFTECSIYCKKCKKVEKDFNTDDYYFTEKLINKGWTLKKGRILCGDCS